MRVGLGIALWTATTAMVALIDALTVAYHETETRSFLRRTLLGLLFVLSGALLLGAVIAVAGMISRTIDDSPGYVRAVGAVVAWTTLAVLMSAMLAVLYRFAPDRKKPQWRWTTWGAAGATVLWAVTSAALFTYVRNLGTYGTTYGSLAGVAISMLWLWLTVLLIEVPGCGEAVAQRVERVRAVPRLRRRDPQDHLHHQRHRVAQRRYRRAVRAQGHFPNDAAALKCLYLVTRSLDPTGRGRARWVIRWKAALNAFAITFEGRINPSDN